MLETFRELAALSTFAKVTLMLLAGLLLNLGVALGDRPDSAYLPSEEV